MNLFDRPGRRGEGGIGREMKSVFCRNVRGSIPDGDKGVSFLENNTNVILVLSMVRLGRTFDGPVFLQRSPAPGRLCGPSNAFRYQIRQISEDRRSNDKTGATPSNYVVVTAVPLSSLDNALPRVGWPPHCLSMSLEGVQRECCGMHVLSLAPLSSWLSLELKRCTSLSPPTPHLWSHVRRHGVHTL